MFFDKIKTYLTQRYSISVFNICIPQKIKFWHAANLQNRIRESDIAFGRLFFFKFSLLCNQYKQIFALNLSHLTRRILNQVNYWWMFDRLKYPVLCSIKICANDFLMGGSQDEKKYTEQYKKNKLRTIDREKSPIVDIFDERIKLLNWLLCGLCEYNFIFEIDEVHGRRHVNALSLYWVYMIV